MLLAAASADGPIARSRSIGEPGRSAMRSSRNPCRADELDDVIAHEPDVLPDLFDGEA